jgi:carbohydrate-binding DOMON domain-containing protein
MRRPGLTNKKTMTNTNTMTKAKTKTMTKTFREHPQRAILETCDLRLDA